MSRIILNRFHVKLDRSLKIVLGKSLIPSVLEHLSLNSGSLSGGRRAAGTVMALRIRITPASSALDIIILIRGFTYRTFYHEKTI